VNKEEKEEDEKEQVWRMLSMDLALGFFLFDRRDDITCDVEKLLRLTQHEDMMVKQNQSLLLTFILQLHNSSK